MRRAKILITTDNQSDLIRMLMNLGLERLEEAFITIKSVTHPLKMSETTAIASSIKIYLLKAKSEQLKEIKA